MRARSYAIDEARPSFVGEREGRKMSWDTMARSYLLLRAFGHPIELSFSEGEERDEPDDFGAIANLEKKNEDIRGHHPNYHLTSDKLHSAIRIRRSRDETSVEEAPSEAAQTGLEALEQASDETDSLVVDALLSGRSSAIGVRHTESAKEEVFPTQFFHDRPFSEVEESFVTWLFASLKNQVTERREQGKNFSSLQKPIEDFAEALAQSDLNVTNGKNGLARRTKSFATSL